MTGWTAGPRLKRHLSETHHLSHAGPELSESAGHLALARIDSSDARTARRPRPVVSDPPGGTRCWHGPQEVPRSHSYLDRSGSHPRVDSGVDRSPPSRASLNGSSDHLSSREPHRTVQAPSPETSRDDPGSWPYPLPTPDGAAPLPQNRACEWPGQGTTRSQGLGLCAGAPAGAASKGNGEAAGGAPPGPVARWFWAAFSLPWRGGCRCCWRRRAGWRHHPAMPGAGRGLHRWQVSRLLASTDRQALGDLGAVGKCGLNIAAAGTG